MKKNIVSECPEYLLKCDATKFPLLSEVWTKLEENYKSTNREDIYRQCNKEEPPTMRYFIGTLNRLAQTEMEIFLDTIYGIDMCSSRAGLNSIINAINEMPGGASNEWDSVESSSESDYDSYDMYKYKHIREIRKMFLSYINLIDKTRQENEKKNGPSPLSGNFRIIPHPEGDKQISFGDFQSFRDGLLEHIRHELLQRKIPLFHCVCHFHEDDESKIGYLADRISYYVGKYVIPVEDFGLLLWELLGQGFNIQFRCNFHELYCKAATKALAFEPPKADPLRKEARRLALDRKKELLKSGESLRQANTIVSHEFKNNPKYKTLFKGYDISSWKVFLQEPKKK